MYIYDVLIRYVAWFVGMIGLWFLVAPTFNFKKAFKNSRLSFQGYQKKRIQKSKVFHHLDDLLTITLNVHGYYAVLTFIYVCLLLGFVAFMGLNQVGHDFLFNLTLAIVVMITPYGAMRLRLHRMRVAASFEGEALISELLNNYKIMHFNISEAIDVTVSGLGNYSKSQKVVARLAWGLKDYRTEDELEKVMDQLYFAFDTSCAMSLSNQTLFIMRFYTVTT